MHPVNNKSSGKPRMYRQGDVLIRSITDFTPESMETQKNDGKTRIVLAHGEVTGHAHAIHDPGVIAWQLGDTAKYLEVPETGATVVHEEHDPIELPGGLYEVVRQREFDGLGHFRERAMVD